MSLFEKRTRESYMFMWLHRQTPGRLSLTSSWDILDVLDFWLRGKYIVQTAHYALRVRIVAQIICHFKAAPLNIGRVGWVGLGVTTGSG